MDEPTEGSAQSAGDPEHGSSGQGHQQQFLVAQASESSPEASSSDVKGKSAVHFLDQIDDDDTPQPGPSGNKGKSPVRSVSYESDLYSADSLSVHEAGSICWFDEVSNTFPETGSSDIKGKLPIHCGPYESTLSAQGSSSVQQAQSIPWLDESDDPSPSVKLPDVKGKAPVRSYPQSSYPDLEGDPSPDAKSSDVKVKAPVRSYPQSSYHAWEGDRSLGSSTDLDPQSECSIRFVDKASDPSVGASSSDPTVDLPPQYEDVPDINPRIFWGPSHPPPRVPKPRTPIAALVANARPIRRSFGQECSHSTMIRLYLNDDEVCDSCRRVPPLGWLLICYEDYTDREPPPVGGNECFSPAVLRAFQNGHYTKEQIEFLFWQKLRVCDTARVDKSPFYSSAPSREPVARYDDDDDDDEMWTENVEDAGPSNQDREAGGVPVPTELEFPCYRKWCIGCRPHYKERSWLGLNAICLEPEVPFDYVLDMPYRPVSDVRIVRSLGQRQFSEMDIMDTMMRTPFNVIGEPVHVPSVRRSKSSGNLRAEYEEGEAAAAATSSADDDGGKDSDDEGGVSVQSQHESDVPLTADPATSDTESNVSTMKDGGPREEPKSTEQ